MNTTDFDSHRIEGFVKNRGFASVPLISRVADNLYQGGCIGGIELPEYIDFVLSLYPWEQYELSHLNKSQARMEVEMYDHAGLPDLDQLHQLADMVNTRRKEGTVLVHCQAGLNRSGLVTALALIKSGMAPKAAIDLLRESRCKMVLCNETFYQFLIKLPSRGNS